MSIDVQPGVDTYIETWLRSACPVFYFHTKEEYFPTSIDHLLNNSRLLAHGKDLFLQQSPENRVGVISTIQKYDPNVYLVIHPKVFHGSFPDAPIYTHVRSVDDEDDEETASTTITITNTSHLVVLDLVYYVAYGNNGPQFRCCCIHACSHSSDIEHVVVRVRGDLHTGALTILQVYYNCHERNDGQWKAKFETSPATQRPVVYVALYSHAHYPTHGTWWWLCGLIRDPCSAGFRWEPQQHIRLTVETTPWIQYRSGWTRERKCPMIRYNSLPITMALSTAKQSNTWYRRICCPCVRLVNSRKRQDVNHCHWILCWIFLMALVVIAFGIYGCLTCV